MPINKEAVRRQIFGEQEAAAMEITEDLFRRSAIGDQRALQDLHRIGYDMQDVANYVVALNGGKVGSA